MARKLKDDLRTPDEIRADVPPEHAAARAPELHAFIESEVLRQLKAEHHPINISVDMILSFADNPYQVLDNEEMDELVQSIKECGILTPLIVMPKPNDAHVLNSSADTGGCMPHRRQGWKPSPPLFATSAVTKPRSWWWTVICTGNIFCPARKQRLTN